MPVGIHTFSLAEAQAKLAEGWQFVAVASELRFMSEGAAAVVRGLGLAGGEAVKY